MRAETVMNNPLKNRRLQNQYLDVRGHLYSFRSSWEREYAEVLDRCGVAWEYEPRLLLSSGEVYVPDFLVAGQYVEIKGWARPAGMRKAQQAIKDGRALVLVVGRPAFERLLAAASGPVALEV